MNFKDYTYPISHSSDSDIGVLLIHGYTSTPGSLYDQANFFIEQGYNVELPLLPGHGTTVEDMNQVSYKDWLKTVENSYFELKKRSKKLFIFGLSMGGALALYLAEKYSNEINGIIIVNNTLYIKGIAKYFAPLISIFVKYIPPVANDIKKENVIEPAYDKNPTKAICELLKMLKIIKKDIKKVTCPVLIFKSNEDHVIPVEVAEYTFENISSNDKQFVFLNDSYHVATMDNDKDIINQYSNNFILNRI